MNLLSFFTNLFSSGISGIGDGALKIRQAVTGEMSEAGQLKTEETLKDISIAQAATNTAETIAGKGGWRTDIGMTCAYAFKVYVIYTIILYPLIVWSIDIYNAIKEKLSFPIPPAIDFDVPMTIMVGMLGIWMGTLKTIEKAKGLRGFKK